MHFRTVVSLVLLPLLTACTSTRSPTPHAQSDARAPAPALPDAGPSASPALSAEDRALLERADILVVANLDSPRITSVLESYPGISIHEFRLDHPKTLFGTPVPHGTVVEFQSETITRPLPAGKPMLVALRREQSTLPSREERFAAMDVVPSTPEREARLRQATAPDGVALSVEQVAPAKVVRFENEYGDGLFDVVLENRGKATVEVPDPASALVVVDDHGRQLRAAHQKPSRTLTLEPGKSIRARVDVKPFGLVSPAGGYRAYYSFRVDPFRATSFFYYTDRLHGPLMGKIDEP
ncbi:MAG: hypothetical protein U0263_04675 [Polyangiaceae bacterium]